MRVSVLLILLMSIVPTDGLNAQPIKAWGFAIAVTSADQSFDYTFLDGFNTQRRIGFGGSLFVEWSLVQNLSLLTQIEYSQRGMGQDDLVRRPGTAFNRVDYLSFPILAKLGLTDDVVQPFVLAGPRVDILLGYDSEDDAFNIVYDKFNKTVLGGTVGIGLQTGKLILSNLSLQARFNFDVTQAYETEFLKVKNNAFDIWLGVTI